MKRYFSEGEALQNSQSEFHCLQRYCAAFAQVSGLAFSLLKGKLGLSSKQVKISRTVTFPFKG